MTACHARPRASCPARCRSTPATIQTLTRSGTHACSLGELPREHDRRRLLVERRRGGRWRARRRCRGPPPTHIPWHPRSRASVGERVHERGRHAAATGVPRRRPVRTGTSPCPCPDGSSRRRRPSRSGGRPRRRRTAGGGPGSARNRAVAASCGGASNSSAPASTAAASAIRSIRTPDRMRRPSIRALGPATSVDGCCRAASETRHLPDKGTPVVRRARKVTGLPIGVGRATEGVSGVRRSTRGRRPVRSSPSPARPSSRSSHRPRGRVDPAAAHAAAPIAIARPTSSALRRCARPRLCLVNAKRRAHDLRPLRHATKLIRVGPAALARHGRAPLLRARLALGSRLHARGSPDRLDARPRALGRRREPRMGRRQPVDAAGDRGVVDGQPGSPCEHPQAALPRDRDRRRERRAGRRAAAQERRTRPISVPKRS